MTKFEEIWFHKGEKRIYGQLFLPEGKDRFPLLIYSHGYGHKRQVFDIGLLVEKGIAVCTFDFCGGSNNSKSDGKTTEMSVLTEMQDLLAVLHALQEDDRYDGIWLGGNSQGGYVTILAGMEEEERIEGIFPICPALVIPEYRKIRFGDAPVPETFPFGELELGRIYAMECDRFPVWERMPRFQKPVWLYHGTEDDVIPISYSQKAASLFPNADLMEMIGSGHMIELHGPDVADDISAHILNRDRTAKK